MKEFGLVRTIFLWGISFLPSHRLDSFQYRDNGAIYEKNIKLKLLYKLMTDEVIKFKIMISHL